MTDEAVQNQCIFHVFDGLREGLSYFSRPSRVALIYAVSPDKPVRIYDPQYLLQGHEPKLRELYITGRNGQVASPEITGIPGFEVIHEPNLQLAGLITFGGRSRSVAYQMWFTEHHPDMCSIGPIERWLEHAVWLMSQDMAYREIPCIGTSGYVLREYASHAVRDHIVDERAALLGWDTRIRVYPTLDAILGISETFEEGIWPRGELAVVEPGEIHKITFLGRFPEIERPLLKNHKHVRKLLLSVERSERKLISDGKNIIGIAVGRMPRASIIADFRGGHGFLRIDNSLICSFFDGKFHSSTRRAKLVQVEEALLETDMDPSEQTDLLKITSAIVHNAQEQRHGCTIVLDLNETPVRPAGQQFEKPLNLRQDHQLALAKSLSQVDGALHICRDIHLHGFACLLDGQSVPGEDRARGARFNSALRFTAHHENILTVVVSADRPVSVMQGGVELTAQCEWKPLHGYIRRPPPLEEYLNCQDTRFA